MHNGYYDHDAFHVDNATADTIEHNNDGLTHHHHSWPYDDYLVHRHEHDHEGHRHIYAEKHFFDYGPTFYFACNVHEHLHWSEDRD